MIKFSIIIGTLNHLEDALKPCLESVKKYTDFTETEVIVVANGCTDGTREYVESLGENFRLLWSDKPMGFAGANNWGIQEAKGQYVILLNNDTILLEQQKNQWINQLHEPFLNPWLGAGITGPLKGKSDPAGHDFLVFFCVMIVKDLFTRTGLLNDIYNPGGGEDTELCIEAERFGYKVIGICPETKFENGLVIGNFPIYHKGEATMNDNPKWQELFLRNSLILAKKYNPEWYRWRLSNNWERAVFMPKDEILPREKTRYEYAAKQIKSGDKVIEIGCSNGYGTMMLPKDIKYTGYDYEDRIVGVANELFGDDNHKFEVKNLETEDISKWKKVDTIIAFEVIEHLKNGLEVVEELKKKCNTLMITVPHNEPSGLWGPHHKLHGLNESMFPGFDIKYITGSGKLSDEYIKEEGQDISLLLMTWKS